MSRTAICCSTILQYPLGSLLGCFVDEIDQFFRSFRSRLRQHPMAQIEHVAGPSSNPCQNLLCTSLYNMPLAQERCRVQVALNRHISNLAPCFVDRASPVNSYHVPTRLLHGSKNSRRPHTKVDPGDPARLEAF